MEKDETVLMRVWQKDYEVIKGIAEMSNTTIADAFGMLIAPIRRKQQEAMATPPQTVPAGTVRE